MSRVSLGILAAVVVFLLGGWLGWTTNQSRHDRALRKADQLARQQDSLLTRLRQDSAAQSAERKAQAVRAAEAQAEAAQAKQEARAAILRAARLAARGDSLTRDLSEATTTRDSLDRSISLITNLSAERDTLRGVVRSLELVVGRDSVALAEAIELQKQDSLRADNAEARALALAAINQSLRLQLAKPQPLFRLPSLPTVGLAGVAVGAVCLFSKVC